MDRYRKVVKKKEETPIKENDIRITSQGFVRNYISYATSLLNEKNGSEIVLKGMGRAINKAVDVAEIIKRRIPGLHQDTVISSVKITDVWEPLEEGLCNVEQTRNVSMITITLCTGELTKTSAGYQAPSSSEQPRSRYNNQQQSRQALRPYNANSEDSNGGGGHERERGQGYSRGRYQNYQENDRYSNQGQGGGRGRGRGYNGSGNGRGRGEGGRGYGGGRRQTNNHPRAGDNQA